MKRTFLLLFSLFSLVSLQAENRVSLTLIPPGKITNKVDLDIRGGIVNESASQQTYQVALYWNKENKDALLYETVVTIPAGKAETVKVVIPTKDRVGKNKVIFKVANEGKAYRKTKDIENRIFALSNRYPVPGRASITGAKSKENIGIRISRR